MAWRTTFRVRGSGRFPIDMLRYDCCYPKHSADVCNIELTPENDGYFKTRTVELVKIHQEKQYNGITFDRWASFTWTVTEMENPEKF